VTDALDGVQIFSKNRPDLLTNLTEADAMIIAFWNEWHDTDSVYASLSVVGTEINMVFTHGGITCDTTCDALFTDKDGRYVLIDFKTGDKTGNNKPFQLWFYWWCLRQTGQVPPEAEFNGMYHHLADNSFQVVGQYPGDGVMESYLHHAGAALDLPFPRPSYYCRWCPWQEPCPVTTKEVESGQ